MAAPSMASTSRTPGSRASAASFALLIPRGSITATSGRTIPVKPVLAGPRVLAGAPVVAGPRVPAAGDGPRSACWVTAGLAGNSWPASGTPASIAVKAPEAAVPRHARSLTAAGRGALRRGRQLIAVNPNRDAVADEGPALLRSGQLLRGCTRPAAIKRAGLARAG